MAFGSASTTFIGVSRALNTATSLDNSSTATYFFQINCKTASPNHSLGLGDQASTNTVDFNDYEAQLRLQPDTSTTFSLDARNGAAFTSSKLKTGLALNTWYNIWMVINQATDKYDIYESAGTGAATKLNSSALSFRNGGTNALTEFLAFAGNAPIADGVSIDNLVYQPGTDLSNPAVNFNPGFVWTPATLAVNGNYTQNNGSTLQLNIQSPASHDLLHVSGTAALGGTLNVTYAIGNSAPHIGDVFHLIDATSISGAFSSLQLPTLGGSLAWDASQLNSTGSISVFSGLPGDFNQDGQLTGADVQDLMAALVDRGDFQATTGMDDFQLSSIDDVNGDGQFTNADVQALISDIANASAGAGSTTAVPEPTSVALAGLGLVMLLFTTRGQIVRHCDPISAV